MFDKNAIDAFLENGDQASLYKLARSKKFNPSDLIFASDNQSVIAKKPSIYIDRSEIHGLGVFTKDPIVVGQNIEQFLCIPLSFKSKYHNDQNLIEYTYSLQQDNDNHGKTMYLLTGLGMVYNHSDVPNAKLVFDPNIRMCSVIAIKFIKENQEITINYHQYK